MNRLLALCVLVSTAVGVIVNRREIAQAYRSVVDMMPHPGFDLGGEDELEMPLPAQALREVMDITRPAVP